MPLYDFRCSGCGRTVELMGRHGEVAAPTCEQCGEVMARQLPRPSRTPRSGSPGTSCCGLESSDVGPACGAGGSCCGMGDDDF